MADLPLTDTQPMRSSFGGLYGGESHENVTVSQFNPKENIFHEEKEAYFYANYYFLCIKL